MKINFQSASYMLIASFTCISFQCSKNPIGETVDSPEGKSVVIHLNDKRQVVENFGASDAWAIQSVGLWPDAKRNQVADWLFSLEEDENGKPKGIGLSFWRFNIGAGSAAQNNIGDEWRRAEGFLKEDLTYDWTKQAGQRWFLKAAKERGAKYLLGFTNSPPIQLTRNGNAFSSNGEEANIAPENYKSFAKFLVDVTKQLHEQGIGFDYLSPFNEPQWDWTGNGQEGSPYKNTEMFAITKILDSTITAENLNIRIQIAEAGKLNYLYEKADKPTRGDQIKEFFHSGSPLYVGDLPNVDRVISGHSYFTSAPVSTLRSVRENVINNLTMASVPLQFWQSEYCVLGDHEEITATGKDTGMATALYVARIIHNDLTVANASAWHWWLSVSAYDYKDGLIYVEKKKTDGAIEDSKLLWALGNYSRFIRPGAQRVNVTSESNIDNSNGVMVSTYYHPEEKTIVTVVVNYGQIDSEFVFKVPESEVKFWKPYLTGSAEDEDLKPLPPVESTEKVIIPKRSVVTLVGALN